LCWLSFLFDYSIVAESDFDSWMFEERGASTWYTIRPLR